MAKGAETLNWIDALPDELRAAVMAQMKTVRVREGALICERFTPAKGLFRVVSGTVRLFSLAPDGREMIYKLNGAGESFGDIAAIKPLWKIAAVAKQMLTHQHCSIRREVTL